MLRAQMPEAAVDEYGNPLPRKNDVRAYSDILCDDGMVLPESESLAM